MHVTDISINKTLGMQLAPSGNGYILEMRESPIVLNHVGTVHASAQFALAEATSGEFLLRHMSDAHGEIFAVLRSSQVKFRKPARGTLRASARFVGGNADLVMTELATRGRTLVPVFVDVTDTSNVVTMTGQYDWLLQRQMDTA
jgi:acyl-coenzyme A thioesterase PaaI-like protein